MQKSRQFLILSAILLLTVAFLFGGCTQGTDDGGVMPGSINGVVTDNVTGQAIEGVRVSFGVHSTQTASDGSYTLKNLPVGVDQTVIAVKEGYENYQSETINLTSGEIRTVDVAMTPVAVDTGTVTGTVTENIPEEAGRALAPLPGVEVTIGGLTDTTDEDGVYIINGVPQGNQTVTATKEGYQNYSGTVDVVAGEVVTNSFQMIPYDQVDEETPTVPANGGVDVSVDQVILVNFQHDITQGPDFDGITVNDGTGDIATDNSISGRTLTIAPLNPLAYGTTYTVTVPTGAVDGVRAMAEDLVFSFTTAEIGEKYAMIISNSGPWGYIGYYQALMNTAFGEDNWDQLNIYTVDATPFSSGEYGFIYLEGSDDDTAQLNTYLDQHIDVIENYVSSGGRLFINAASQGPNVSAPFGVLIEFDYFMGSVTATDENHPIFTGPALPTATAMTAMDYAHNRVVGDDLTPILVNSSIPGNSCLSESLQGNGFIIYGGITSNYFHNPKPQASNVYANILSYCAGLWPAPVE